MLGVFGLVGILLFSIHPGLTAFFRYYPRPTLGIRLGISERTSSWWGAVCRNWRRLQKETLEKYTKAWRSHSEIRRSSPLFQESAINRCWRGICLWLPQINWTKGPSDDMRDQVVDLDWVLENYQDKLQLVGSENKQWISITGRPKNGNPVPTHPWSQCWAL